MWPLINDVQTGGTPRYPDLQPQRFVLDPHTTLEECEAVARTLRRWTVVTVEVAERRIEAIYKTRLMGFEDDVTIRVEAAEDGGAIVHVRSRSRVGKSDFGQNARTIRSFQGALAAAVRARLQRREPGT
jgi:uncharacterized protein (DUF1499 family)